MMNWIERGTRIVASLLLAVGTMLVVANVVMRLLGHPIPGTYELTGWIVGIAMAAGLAYTQIHLGHVNIDLVPQRLPERTRDLLESAILLMSAVLFALATVYLLRYAAGLHRSGSTSEALHSPVYIWAYAFSVGVASFEVVLLLQFIKRVASLMRSAESYAPE